MSSETDRGRAVTARDSDTGDRDTPTQEAADRVESPEKRSSRVPEGPPHPRSGGTWQTLRRVFSEFSEDQLTDSAAALTYYGLLALFPALIALVSIVGLIGDPQKIISDATRVVASIGPASAVNTFKGPINGLIAAKSSAGVFFIGGLLVALWSASGYVGAFIRASNRIYEVEEGRSALKLRPLQMLVTLVLVVLQVVILVALVLTGPIARTVGNIAGAGNTTVTVWDIAKWPVMLAIVIAMFAILYWSSPNAKLGGFKNVLPGAAMALVVWLIASVGFAFYVANFGSYNKTYGSLGGIIVFLVWVWITNVVLLLGAEFNAERERSREINDGAVGAERELQLRHRTDPKAKRRSRTA